jgi:hypothetical protein
LVSRSRLWLPTFFAKRGWAGHLEEEVTLGVAGQRDGQPAHEPHVDVVGDLEADFAHVETEGLVLVEDRWR